MNIEEYMSSRVDDQIKWYSQKSQIAQRRYKTLQITEIIFAALIPLLSGYATENTTVAIIVGILGSIIAVIESITKLNKYHENWIQYRTTCELLKYHKHLYLTQTPPYSSSNETIENVFVRNIEDIISSENSQWKVIISEEQSKNSN